MRTTVIPAQITTVEDKIAGSLNLTQILLLMVPVFWGTFVYAVFSPHMKLALYKAPLVLIVLVLCFGLSIRIQGIVVFNWLAILAKYHIRPKFYLFNKNDLSGRTVDAPVLEPLPVFSLRKAKKKVTAPSTPTTLKELMKLESLLKDNRFAVSFRASSKGVL